MEPAKRGDSINLGWSGADPQDIWSKKRKSPRSGRQQFVMTKSQVLLYRTLRALGFFVRCSPRVSLCSTPGRGPQPGSPAGVRDFMLPPALRVSDR
jgi:hypothetical protein